MKATLNSNFTIEKKRRELYFADNTFKKGSAKEYGGGIELVLLNLTKFNNNTFS